MTGPGVEPNTEGTPGGLDPGTWRLAVVAGVRMDMPGEHPEVLVHEAVSPWRELAIPVGMAEGNAIAYAWRGLTTPRPLTHALFTEVLERHNVQLEAVRITARRGRSYFAELDTVGPRGRQVISCRPSDALALVLRQRMPTPVLVAEWVFEPEDDIPVIDAPVVESPVVETPVVETPVVETPVVEVPEDEPPVVAWVDEPAGTTSEISPSGESADTESSDTGSSGADNVDPGSAG
jgi:bifunctional DNase/RNase